MYNIGIYSKVAPKRQKLPRSVAEIPWRHNILLMEKLENVDQRLWYAGKAIENCLACEEVNKCAKRKHLEEDLEALGEKV